MTRTRLKDVTLICIDCVQYGYENLSIENIEGEEWADIKGQEGLYQVSSMGRFKSLNYRRQNKPNILKQHFAREGSYLKMELGNNKKGYFSHRYVAEAFIPNPDNLPMVNHKNGDKRDNRSVNLEWVTRSQNTIHAVHQLKSVVPPSNLGRTGALSSMAKKINQVNRHSGSIINTFYGTLEAQRETGIHYALILRVLKGGRVTAGGYKWEYAE